jgi:hypothetical protein
MMEMQCFTQIGLQKDVVLFLSRGPKGEKKCIL